MTISYWKKKDGKTLLFTVGGPGLKAKKIILTNVDTSNVINMTAMFGGIYNLEELDLSDFDTSNVTAMDMMFSSNTELQSITFGTKFVHKQGATTSGMFNNCPSQDRPTGDTWNDVSFD